MTTFQYNAMDEMIFTLIGLYQEVPPGFAQKCDSIRAKFQDAVRGKNIHPHTPLPKEANDIAEELRINIAREWRFPIL